MAIRLVIPGRLTKGERLVQGDTRKMGTFVYSGGSEGAGGFGGIWNVSFLISLLSDVNTTVSGNATQVTYSNATFFGGTNTLVANGTFSNYNANGPQSGTVTSFTYTTYFSPGVPVTMTVTGISISVANLNTWVMNGNVPALEAALFGAADTFTGTAFSDFILGYGGGDTINAGAGNDNVFGDVGNDALNGGDGSDFLSGGGGTDTIHGGAGDDTFETDEGADQLFGEDGNDRFYADSGDLVDGGDGADHMSFHVTSNVTLRPDLWASAAGQTLPDGTIIRNIETYAIGGDSVTLAPIITVSPGYSPLNTIDFVTRLTIDFSGSSLAIGMIQVHSSQNAILLGGPFGDLYLQTRSLNHPTSAYTLTGSALNDTLLGAGGSDVLNGGDGNDSLQGYGGSNTLSGGDGDDTFIADFFATNVINGGAGVDLVDFSSSGATAVNLSLTTQQNTGSGFVTISNVENVLGSFQNDTITGNAGANVLNGADGNDTLNGGAGADALIGGVGDDTYVVDNVGGTVTENFGEGTDLVQSSVDFALSGNIETLELTGGSAISGTGNGSNNTLTGNTAANTLDGGTGADAMAGGAGDDIYVVDDAGDTVTENPAQGTDSVQASISYVLTANVENLSLTGGLAINGTGNGLNNSITGNTQANTLDGGAGADAMIGGDGNDTYIVDEAGDVVTELDGQGQDEVQVSFTYALSLNLENLTLTGLAAINGAGNGVDNAIIGNNEANVLTGNAGNDTLQGRDGADTLLGGDGNDVMIAGAGADALNGGAGADAMTGGLGDDTYYIDNAGDTVTENASEGTDAIRSVIGVSALAANVENLVLEGVAVTGNGNALANTITGNAQNNSLNGMAGADAMAGGLGNDTYFVDDAGDVVTEASGEGADIIFSTVSVAALAANVENLIISALALTATGNALSNTISGNAQNNTLNGGTGEDTLAGGIGNDLYVVNSAGDVVTENVGAGADSILAFINIAALTANVENVTLAGTATSATGNELSNILTGNSLDNTLVGGLGNDQLNGAVGADAMSGGGGDDAYLVENAGDVVTELSGEGNNDIIYAFISLSSLADHVERVTITGAGNLDAAGNNLANRVNGNAGNNALTGLDGADVIQGLAGADTINGGLGLDILTGGADADTFVFAAVAESGVTGSTRDLVNDFAQGSDLISLAGIDAITGGADDAFTLIGTAAFSNTAGELRFDLIDNASGTDYTIISMDVNGDGIADSQITLLGLVTLTVSDFGL
jgi:trimeric autotransporter adhesin